jgi:hypothetical protein
MWSLDKFVSVASIRNHHDGVGVVERCWIGGEPVEVILNSHVLTNIRVVEHHLEELHGPRIIVQPVANWTVALGAGNQNYLARLG